MAKVLSTDELQDLLSTVEESAENPRGGQKQRNVAVYDFKRPSMLTKDQYRALQHLNENAAQIIAGALSDHLRSPVEVNLVSIDLLTYADLIGSLPVPICVRVLTMAPLLQKGMLTLDLPLAFAMIDRLLGGPGYAMEELRSLTAIEESVLEAPTELILDKFQEVWKDAATLHFAVEDRKMDPKLVQIMGGSELVLRITFAVGGQIGSGELNFCMPFDSLEQIMPRDQVREKFFNSVKTPNKEETGLLKASLGRVPLRVSVRLGGTELSLRQLLGLQPNSVIRLNRKITDSLPVLVEGQTKYEGRAGLIGKNRGVKICD